VTVGHIRCVEATLELYPFLFLSTSKTEYIRISHSLLLISVNFNTLRSAYSVVTIQKKNKSEGSYLV